MKTAPMKDDWNQQAYRDFTKAVQSGNEQHVRAFLQRGMDPYYQPEGLDALFLNAVDLNQHAVVAVFFEFDVDPNRFRTGNGRTALEIACLNRANKMAGLLLDHGANPNIPIGDDGFSLMHYVVSADNAELALKMMESGVRMDVEGPGGQTIMNYAAPKARVAIHEYHAMKASKRLHKVHHRLRRPAL